MTRHEADADTVTLDLGDGRQTLSVDQAIELARKDHLAGRLQEARSVYGQILQAHPDYPDALHLMGVTALQGGAFQEAVDYISRALSARHDFPKAHNNMGAALFQLRRFEDAIASFRTALDLDPETNGAHHNIGNAYKELNCPEQARDNYEKALLRNPEDPGTHFNLGEVLWRLGELQEALAHYREVTSRQPGFLPAHQLLGELLCELERPEEAVSSFRQALSVAPRSAEIHNNLGVAYKMMGDLEQAIDCYRQSLELDPGDAKGYGNLGNTQMALGLRGDAEASFRKATRLDPDYAEAHRFLAHIRKHKEYDEDIRAMEAAFDKVGVSDRQRMHLAFGLGTAFENLQDYDKAFHYLATGNAIKRKEFQYATEEHGRYFQDIARLFDPALFAARHGTGSADETPIFILGVPRSGTTLVEQILASHPQVHGAGEIGTLSEVARKWLGEIDGVPFPHSIHEADAGVFRRVGEDYLRELRTHSSGARFIVNKSTGNHVYAGLIKLALPNATIVHCNRNPADNGLSLFRTLFTKEGHHYAYDLAEIGRYFPVYTALMDHWRAVLPGVIFDVDYEGLIADQEATTRALLEFCGLDWDDACLDFHKSKRPVHTASVAQVRKPIYADSIESWRRYEKHLSPMLDELEKKVAPR